MVIAGVLKKCPNDDASVPEALQFQAIAGKVKDNGRLILAVCNTGFETVGAMFASGLYKLTGSRLNIPLRI